MVGMECKVGRYFICRLTYVRSTIAGIRIGCYDVGTGTPDYLSAALHVCWGSRSGRGEGLEKRQREKRLDRNVIIPQKGVDGKHVHDIKACQDITNWNIGDFPRARRESTKRDLAPRYSAHDQTTCSMSWKPSPQAQWLLSTSPIRRKCAFNV